MKPQTVNLKRPIMQFSTLIVLCMLIMSSCSPPAVQTSETGDQCPDFNIIYTTEVDEPYSFSCSPIENIVQNFLDEPNNSTNGVAVGIVRNNEIYYLKGFGLANVEENIPFTYATPSGVGSISKSLTALGILELVERGIIDLDEPARNYLPQNAFAPQVSIRQLLSHSSGMPRWPNWNPNLNTEAELQQITSLEHPAFLPRIAFYGYRETPLSQLDPGEGIYSNAGYSLLGAIIDYVTTQTVPLSPSYEGIAEYERYIWNEIGRPMQMYSMCLYTYWRTEDILNLAQGYNSNSEPLNPTINPDGGPGGWRGPAGGWAMTIGDLCRLMIGIHSNTVISQDLSNQMLDTEIDIDINLPDNSTYGLGIMKGRIGGETIIWHSGWIDGYTSLYTFWPEREFGIAILSNRGNDPGVFNLTDLLRPLFIPNAIGALALCDGPGFTQGGSTQEDLENEQLLRNVFDLAQNDWEQYSSNSQSFLEGLRQEPEGARMFDALEKGDTETFHQLFRKILRQRKTRTRDPDSIQTSPLPAFQN